MGARTLGDPCVSKSVRINPDAVRVSPVGNERLPTGGKLTMAEETPMFDRIINSIAERSETTRLLRAND